MYFSFPPVACHGTWVMHRGNCMNDKFHHLNFYCTEQSSQCSNNITSSSNNSNAAVILQQQQWHQYKQFTVLIQLEWSGGRFIKGQNQRLTLLSVWLPLINLFHFKQMQSDLNCTEQSNSHTQPFYGSLDSVQDKLDQPVPEETFTHSHLSWSSVIPNLLPPSTLCSIKKHPLRLFIILC